MQDPGRFQLGFGIRVRIMPGTALLGFLEFEINFSFWFEFGFVFGLQFWFGYGLELELGLLGFVYSFWFSFKENKIYTHTYK